ncbi:MAG TPA: cell surface protein SprA, partial [Methylomirabilota bacterium]|nr:cell surface protein SprA [Methylomirabilota bacterium]
MIGTSTLSAIAFLATVSGLPGLNTLAPATKEYARAKAAAVAADTLPPPWRPSWRLDLENSFVQAGLRPIGEPYGPVKLNLAFDPRKLRIEVDPEAGTFRSSVEVGDIALGAGYRQPLSRFSRDFASKSFRDRWLASSRANVNTLGSATPIPRSGLSLPIPVRLPSKIASILGPGGPALNVSGSESIRLSGTSNWTNQSLGAIGQRQSLFPSLDMQQDLDIRLEGQLSDRVKVNLLQNSANQVPLANRIAINYRGDEDDFVQALDLGNTNLSLPGTQYVSYSGKNEGLFGVKFASRIGALDFTGLASKQEGRSERAVYTGGSSVNRPPPFSNLEWVKGQYFFLYDANYGTYYDVDQGSIRLYLDDGNSGNDNGQTTRGRAQIDPDHAMGLAVSDTVVTGSFDILNSGPDQQFEVLNNLYKFNDTTFKVIRLKNPIILNSNQVLAVTYKATPILPGGARGTPFDVGGRIITTPGPDSGARVMKLLRVPRGPGLLTQNTDGLYDTTATLAPVRELELKNIYNLGGFQIDPKSFKLMIQSGQNDPPLMDLNGVPIVEMLGLDTWKETTNQPVPADNNGGDGVIDGTGFNTQTRSWVDYENGTLFLPDVLPFAPRIEGPGARPFDVLVNQHLRRRATLNGVTGTVNAPDPGVYDLFNPQSNQANYYFNAEFAAARSGGGDITLGRGNVLDNSEAVVVNGERWTRDRDYTIDYDLGRITLKRQLGPTDQLSIDYSYAPLFAQASKTLIGSAFSVQGRDRSLGGAFLYESKGAQDIRPRLGEEPSQTLITDLNTELRFKPAFLTRLADRLPGVRTTTPSEFNIQAEAGMSFPNPNTRNEVFVDDMEGVRDAVSLTLTPERWTWSSVPRRADHVVLGTAVATTSFLDLEGQNYAEIHWYQPVKSNDKSNDDDLVIEGDLRPKLPAGQNANSQRNVLALSIPKIPPGFVAGADTMWSGLTYSLDPFGLDLSRSQFIELWVSDWNDHHDPRNPFPRVRGNQTPNSGVKLHIDIGRVSEDQMRAPNRPPDNVIDTEDRRPRDNQLNTIDNSEDTGIDGIDNAAELDSVRTGKFVRPGLVTERPGADPEGDDFEGVIQNYPSAMDPRRYVYANGTENNHLRYPVPNTEDMNGNETADLSESYFEYTVDLADTSSGYLVTDVLKDFGDDADNVTPISPTKNGWRRYRIPLTDSLRVRFGAPDLTLSQHVRVWLEGMRYPEADSNTAAETGERPLLMIGGLDIVGSRWRAADLTPRQRDIEKTTLTLDAVNSVDNADIYFPLPFDPGDTKGNGNEAIQRREQSIALEFADLAPDDTLEAFRTFSIPEDYSRYGKLNWFSAAFEVSKTDLNGGSKVTYDPATDPLFYFVRFASDDKGQSYYEIKRKMPRSSEPKQIAWEQVLSEIVELSQAKLDPAFPTRDPILFRTVLANGDSLILKGRPSFTRLLRISTGVINQSTSQRFTGQLWFDELRATDVSRDVGIANRVFVNGRVANLFDYNVAWNSRDANFLSVGESRGTGSKITSLSVATHFEPQRFFEGTGIQLPITYSQNQNVTQPRFTAGDDIVRTGALSSNSETRNLSRSLTASYSRVWSDRSNALLRYTLGGIAANINRTTTEGHAPTGLGTSFSTSASTSAGVTYQVALRPLASIAMPMTKARFYPLPERFFWNYSVSQTESDAYTRLAVNDSIVPSSSQRGRAANVNFGADARPVDMLTYHVEGQRNLALGGVRLDKLGFINFGRLTGWRQSFGSHTAVGPSWFKPSFGWSSNYNQTNDIQSVDLSKRLIGNGTDLTMNLDLPFDRLAGTVGVNAPPRPATPPDSTGKKAKGPRRPFRPIRGLLSRLGMISTDARIGRTSNYSSVSGTASPLYLAGLAENPGFGEGNVFAEPGNIAVTGVDWRGNARTTIPLTFGASLLARASLGDRTSNLNGVKTRSRDWRFPDFEVQYGQVANLLGLTKILDSPQLRSAYARSNSVDYQNSRSLTSGTSRSDDFRPLFSVRGRLRNGTDADFRLERRSSVRESFQLGRSTATDQTTDINFSLTRSYSQGQKVNILGRSST